MKKPALLVPLAMGHLANDWAPSAVWLIAPAVAAAMGLSPAEVGLLITIHAVGASLAYVPAGLLADHVSNGGRLLLGTFWWVAAGYALASLAPGFWTLVAVLAAAGMGSAAWHPIATGVLVREHAARRAQALGVHAMGGTLAEVLAPLAVGLLLAHVDWRTALQLSALPAALMGLVFIRLARAIPAVEGQPLARGDLAAFWRTWRRPRGLQVIALLSTYNMALFALLSMTPLYLQTDHGLSTGETGIAFSVMLLMGAVAQPVIGRLSDSAGRGPVILAGNAVAALAACGVWLSGSLVAILVLLAVAIGVLVAIRSALLAAAVEYAGHREGTTLGLAFALMDGVGALGALMAGAVGGIDLAHAYLLAAVFSLAAIGSGLLLRPER